MAANKNEITMCAVGDIVVDREEPESMYAFAAPILRQADITFGQLESTITDKPGFLMCGGWGPRRCAPENIKALTSAGFNVISFASNNCMDWGPECFLDTIDRLRQNGVDVIGAGKDIAAARKPAILNVKGNRVGFLGYNSIVIKGYEAGPKKPGCAPVRAWTHYDQVDAEQPGTPPVIISRPYVEDLEAMVQDIKKLKSQVDVVAVSFHWGIHFAPKTIAMYQPELAHAAIDAGADIILGHHPHILKGVEVYKGKVILYSMNMFGFDVVDFPDVERLAASQKLYNYEPDPEYPLYPFHPEAKMTILVKCLISGKQIQKVSFLPALINKQNQPEIVTKERKDFGKIVGYIEEITKDQALNAKFIVEGDEVVIAAQ